MLKMVWESVHCRWKVLLLILHFSFVRSFVQLTSNLSKIQEHLNEQRNITNRLLEGYDKRFIPTLSGYPLKVELQVVISDVLKLDDREMESEMIVYIRQTWFDYRLSWNSTKRIKIREHFLDKIWLPDVRIINIKDMMRFEGFGGINMNIYSNGRVYFSQLALVKTSCPMDLHDFPMDKQTCFLNFSSFAYGKSLLTFSPSKKKVVVKPTHLPQFEFMEAEEIEDSHSSAPRLDIALTFHRRSGYYILQIYVPSMFLVVLSWLAFLMESSDIADRLALEITMILSIVFLHGGINTSLPHVSYAKASDWFVIVSFAFIFMALLETMLVYRVSMMITRTQRQHDLPTCLKRHSSILSCKPKKEEMVQNNQDLSAQDKDYSSSALKDQNVAVRTKASIHKCLNLAVLVDKICIIAFPSLYIGFNVFYWSYYKQ